MLRKSLISTGSRARTVFVANAFLTLLVVACVCWWGAVWAMRARTRREQTARVRQALSCGKCGYARAGLETTGRCPECGSSPADVAPAPSLPGRPSAHLAWVPILSLVTCAAIAAIIGQPQHFLVVLVGAIGMCIPAAIVSLVMGVWRKATTRVLLGHLCASGIAAVGLTAIVSVDYSTRSETGYDAVAAIAMLVLGLGIVPLLTCLWEGAVVIWSLWRPKP